MVINPIPALSDNYIWAVIDTEKMTAIIVDPGDASPVIDFLEQKKLQLQGIFITHHHWDHTNGISELKKKYNVDVFAPATENINGVTKPIQEGDDILNFKILDIPGHTLGHIAYYSHDSLFCGDTLFAAGCGKVFEGTAEQMYTSLMKLAALPETIKIYCGHEYTLNNLYFAKTVEPENKKITERMAKVKEIRAKNLPSLPSILSDEKATNPFLRCDSHEIIDHMEKYIGHKLNNPVEVFAALRRCKDHFTI